MSTQSGAIPRSAAVRLALARAVLRLQPEAMREVQARTTGGLQAVPRRGAEVGGLLLGSAAGEEFSIENVCDLPCEHRFGPSFLLSESDRREISRLAEQKTGIVGMYRSHTRDGSLLQDDDAVLASAIPGVQAIFIVKPDGLWQSVCHVFTRDPRGAWTAAGEFTLPALEAPAAAAVVPLPPRHSHPPRRMLLPTAAACLVILLAAGAWSVWRAARPRPQPAAAAPAPEARPAAGALQLRIERSGGDVKISWNGAAPAIASAVRGQLGIREGAAARDIDMDVDQLRSGNLLYAGSGRSDILFRLEVFDASGRGSAESVRLIAGMASAAAAPPRSPVAIPSHTAAERSVDEPEPAFVAPAAAVTKPLVLPRAATPQQEELPAPAVVRATLPVAAPPALHEYLPLPDAPPPAASRPAAPARAAEPYREARPIRQVRPIAPPSVKAMMTQEIAITVRTVVDETGQVVHAVPVAQSGVVARMLGPVAAEAARGWRFEPARRNGIAVSSNVDLVFRFTR